MIGVEMTDKRSRRKAMKRSIVNGVAGRNIVVVESTIKGVTEFGSNSRTQQQGGLFQALMRSALRSQVSETDLAEPSGGYIKPYVATPEEHCSDDGHQREDQGMRLEIQVLGASVVQNRWRVEKPPNTNASRLIRVKRGGKDAAVSRGCRSTSSNDWLQTGSEKTVSRAKSSRERDGQDNERVVT